MHYTDFTLINGQDSDGVVNFFVFRFTEMSAIGQYGKDLKQPFHWSPIDVMEVSVRTSVHHYDTMGAT